MTEIVDRERRQRLNAIKDELKHVDGVAAKTMYEWGTLFAEVEHDELWREDGATSFTDWVENHTDYSFRSARRAVALAQHFTLDMAERFGSTKLAAALRYVELTTREEEPGDVLALQIKVREKGGQYTSVPFPNASANQILVACRQITEADVAKRRKQEAKAIDSSVRAKVVRLRAALQEAPKGTVRGERVTIRKGKDGRLAVSFQGIAVDEIEAFAEALREHFILG